MLRKMIVAEQLRRIAEKLEKYENSKGSKIGWDGGLHSFIKLLDKIEKTLDENIRKATLRRVKS